MMTQARVVIVEENLQTKGKSEKTHPNENVSDDYMYRNLNVVYSFVGSS